MTRKRSASARDRSASDIVGVGRADWEAVLERAREAIVVVDEEDSVLLCNAEAYAVLKVTREGPLHRPVGSVVQPLALQAILARARQTGQPARTEVLLEDGRTFNAQVTPVEGVGRLLVMQDITHLKELDDTRSELIFTLAHDLRTPLTNIQGYVSLLPRVGPLTEQQEAFIGRVQESVDAITALISDVVEVSRLETGLALEIEMIDLREIIAEAVIRFQPLATEKSQRLRWQRPEDLSLVEGDRIRLRQVMDNLLSNAVRYTDQEGQITVEAGDEVGHVVVRVIDTGIGIPLAEQPHIFEKFYRTDAAKAAGTKGAGLGLAIVKSVIERHNGRVWVESKPGEGSAFSFVLPAVKT